jgi:hypothetical protein
MNMMINKSLILMQNEQYQSFIPVDGIKSAYSF